MPSVCKHCGSSELDKDPARCDVVCTGCGAVLEEGAIVSEVQFQDGAIEIMTANALAENILTQVDDFGHRYLLLDEIVDHADNQHRRQHAEDRGADIAVAVAFALQL